MSSLAFASLAAASRSESRRVEHRCDSIWVHGRRAIPAVSRFRHAAGSDPPNFFLRLSSLWHARIVCDETTQEPPWRWRVFGAASEPFWGVES